MVNILELLYEQDSFTDEVYELALYIRSEMLVDGRLKTSTNRIFHLDVAEFLADSGRPLDATSYEEMYSLLNQFMRTSYKISRSAGGYTEQSEISLISSYYVTRCTEDQRGVLEVDIQLSNWFYEQLIQ